MTDGLVDLNDLLAALEPHGWRRAISYFGLVRLLGDPSHYERIEFVSTGLLEYSRTTSDLLHRKPAEKRRGTAVEVLAHVIARYANEVREAA